MAAEIAKLYANALFELFLESGSDDNIYTQMNEYDTVFRNNHDLIQLLSAPLLTSDEKQSVISKIFDDNGLVFDYLRLICDKGRAEYFSEITEIFNQKYNEYIRECAMIAGIDAPVIYLDFTGGKTTEITKPKYEVLSSHKGRKTFISLYYQDTKDYIGTKKNAGISQDKTMRRYIGRDSQQARENMNKAFKNIDTSPRGPERLDFTL